MKIKRIKNSSRGPGRRNKNVQNGKKIFFKIWEMVENVKIC